MYNKVILMGRLTSDPKITAASETTKMRANYTLAVNRDYSKADHPEADFFYCVAFGNTADFVEKYLKKGTKILVEGTLRNGSFNNAEGQEIRTINVVVNNHWFCESSKNNSEDESTTSANVEPPIPNLEI